MPVFAGDGVNLEDKMDIKKAAEKLIQQIEMSKYVELDTGFQHELTNNKAFNDLKKCVEDNNPIVKCDVYNMVCKERKNLVEIQNEIISDKYEAR